MRIIYAAIVMLILVPLGGYIFVGFMIIFAPFTLIFTVKQKYNGNFFAWLGLLLGVYIVISLFLVFSPLTIFFYYLQIIIIAIVLIK